jgi:hypothetical protein
MNQGALSTIRSEMGGSDQSAEVAKRYATPTVRSEISALDLMISGSSADRRSTDRRPRSGHAKRVRSLKYWPHTKDLTALALSSLSSLTPTNNTTVRRNPVAAPLLATSSSGVRCIKLETNWCTTRRRATQTS